MSKPDSLSQNMILADINPSLLLAGDVPRLIDERQILMQYSILVQEGLCGY